MINYRNLLDDLGAVKKGHFELTSGLHSEYYIEKFRLLEKPEISTLFCKDIADHFNNENIETVAGPTTGGIIIAYDVANYIKKRAIYAEKVDGRRVFRRDFKITKGERILVVDDILTTGGSIVETAQSAEEKGGIIVGLAVFINRSSESIRLPYPLYSVYSIDIEKYAKEDCPLCRRNIPLTIPGSKNL